MYWLLLKKIVWAVSVDEIDLVFGLHGSITITLLTVSCQKLLEYRLLMCCSRECGYGLDRDGFLSLQAQSMASVKSLVFTVLPIDLHPPLFLWLCERMAETENRDTGWKRVMDMETQSTDCTCLLLRVVAASDTVCCWCVHVSVNGGWESEMFPDRLC